MKWYTVLPLLMGGLGLFLYAIQQLSEVFARSFSSKIQTLLEKGTQTLVGSVLIGTVSTVIMDSSSAVIILTIILINARKLLFKQAVGIVLGANIGTTFSSQLIAMDISKYAYIPLFIGLILLFFANRERWKTRGQMIFYFGMLFFGLYVMEEATLPLRSDDVIRSWLFSLENPWKGAALGGLITLIIQSSSATVGLTITLAKQQLITSIGGMAVMLGSELGTCSDTLLATLKGSRQALKTGLFHLFFNFTTILLALFFFPEFVTLANLISSSASIDHQIANAHVLFNVVGVIIFLPLVGIVVRLFDRLLPDKVF